MRLLRLLHRPDDDQRQVRRAVRRPAAQARERITQREMDLAASIQVTEEVMLQLRAHAIRDRRTQPVPRRRRGAQLRRQRQAPARGYSTGSGCSRPPAMPAARSARRWSRTTCYKGEEPATQRPRRDAGRLSRPEFTNDEIVERLDGGGAVFDVLTTSSCSMSAGFARRRQGVGWFQGRMEFGPRALGARSILGDARSPTMQKTLNLKVKYRESFRPFAPSVLREDVGEYFEIDCESPYMLLCADVAQEHRRPHDRGAAGAVRHRPAQRAALESRRSRTSTTPRACRRCIARPIRGIGN